MARCMLNREIFRKNLKLPVNTEHTDEKDAGVFGGWFGDEKHLAHDLSERPVALPDEHCNQRQGQHVEKVGQAQVEHKNVGDRAQAAPRSDGHQNGHVAQTQDEKHQVHDGQHFSRHVQRHSTISLAVNTNLLDSSYYSAKPKVFRKPSFPKIYFKQKSVFLSISAWESYESAQIAHFLSFLLENLIFSKWSNWSYNSSLKYCYG